MILIIGAGFLVALFMLLRHDPAKSAAALCLATVAGGMLYCTIPYSKMKMAGVFFIVFGCLGLIAGLAIMRWLRFAWPKSSALVGTGFVMSVAARAIFDAMRDPDTHDLFFIEVAIGFMVGFAGSSIGSVFGRLVGRGPHADGF